MGVQNVALAFFSLICLFNGLPLALADMNLALLNPAPSRIQGTDFPRKDPVLYRGTQEGHFNAVQAVAAMLGDERQNLESAMFRSIREILLGKQPFLFSRIAGLREEFLLLGVQRHIDLKKLSQKESFTDDQAIEETISIMEAVYTIPFARSRVFDYASSAQEVFPKAFVYSTLHVEVAKIYAPHVVIFKENKPRSLDVNYWNHIANAKWVGTNRSYPDRGEFVSAFYIPYDAITGYQYARRNFNSDWQTWRPLTADLSLVYMKLSIDDENFVLVFDATGLQHVVQVRDQFCSARTQFDPEAEIPKFPDVDCSVKPKLIGTFKRCDQPKPDETACSFPAKIFDAYEKSDFDFTSWINYFGLTRFQNGDFTVFSKSPVEFQKSNFTTSPLTKKKKKS